MSFNYKKKYFYIVLREIDCGPMASICTIALSLTMKAVGLAIGPLVKHWKNICHMLLWWNCKILSQRDIISPSDKILGLRICLDLETKWKIMISHCRCYQPSHQLIFFWLYKSRKFVSIASLRTHHSLAVTKIPIGQGRGLHLCSSFW